MNAVQLSRILYVEDDTDIQELARIALTTFGGYEVEIVAHGDLALDAVKRMQPDLVLLDMQLPGLSGLEILHLLKAQSPPLCDIPVVLLTADKYQQRLIMSKDHPADGLILKPFTPTRLIRQIGDIWERRKG